MLCDCVLNERNDFCLQLDQRVTDILLEEIDTEELNGFLKIVAEYPHATGQKRDLTIANWIR